MQDIIDRLAALRAQDVHRRVFGAPSHEWRATPANMLTVLRFEVRHNVKLPDEFRRFLLEVTNGGAGPGYGLFALDRSEGDDVAEDLSMLSRPFPKREFFELEEPPYPEDDHDEALESYYGLLENFCCEMPGTLTLCHYGCAIRAYLVISGPLAGSVLLDERADGVAPTLFSSASGGHHHRVGRPSSSDGTPFTFLDWYRDWLQASIENS